MLMLLYRHSYLTLSLTIDFPVLICGVYKLGCREIVEPEGNFLVFFILMLTHAGPQWKPVFNCLGIPWVNKNVMIIIIIIIWQPADPEGSRWVTRPRIHDGATQGPRYGFYSIDKPYRTGCAGPVQTTSDRSVHYIRMSVPSVPTTSLWSASL